MTQTLLVIILAVSLTAVIMSPVILAIWHFMGRRTGLLAIGACLLSLPLTLLFVDFDRLRHREEQRNWTRDNQHIIAECVQRTSARWDDCAKSEWTLRR